MQTYTITKNKKYRIKSLYDNIMSHNKMSAFFSGQDQATLREEGNDRNCFVSLIVNNEGTYCAAVTRKLSLTKNITVQTSGVSYEFFGEGKKTLTAGTSPVKTVSEETVIQYFMLDVEREEVENTLSYLDDRFDEIERKKESAKASLPQKSTYIETPGKDDDFFSWIHSERRKSAEAKESMYTSPNKEPTLFDEKTMDEMVDYSRWQPDPTIIHYLCCQLLTSSLIVNKDIDLKQWVAKHMEKKYKEIFEDFDEFSRWADSMVDFILMHYNDPDVPADVLDDWDSYIARVSGAIMMELGEYPSNEYIEEYINLLSMRGYE